MGKGSKGKGKESFAQKTTRLNEEIAHAASLQDQEALLHLWSVRDGHMNSNWGRDEAYYYSKGKGKGEPSAKSKGMGRTQTESSKVHALRKELKELKDQKGQGRRGRSTSRGSSRASSKGSSSKGSKGSSVKSKGKTTLSAKERATRNATKKENRRLKREAAQGEPASGSKNDEPRPTRVCPECLD